MNTDKLEKYVATAQEALRSFLATLLGKEASLRVQEPQSADFDDANARAQQHITFSAGTSKENQWAVVLEPDWLPLLSKSMLGEPIEFGEPGADDLLKELAAQAYGAVRTQLSSKNVKVPDVTVELLKQVSDLGQQKFSPVLLEVPFSIEVDGQTLTGFALLPPVEDDANTKVYGSLPLDIGFPPQEESDRSVDVAPAAFPDLGGEVISGDGADAGFELLAEVELEVTVELGRRKIPLADVLRLTTGSVIELEKLVGEPLEVYANGRLIAEGEAVVMDEQFGIRITNLASNRPRAKAFV